MRISKKQIAEESRLRRLNLINSITGVKPANLIGTRSREGTLNLAIFSSVIHLGSAPALIGFIVRPSGEVRRDTYENIRTTGEYTINCIHRDFTEKAHFTSAKFSHEISEFEQVKLTPEFLDDFAAPFVKESPLKFSLRLQKEIPIELNGTTLMIGEVEDIWIDDHALDERGYVDLSKLGGSGISGLNSYYELQKIADYPYARPHEVPDF